jgi:hypothetical protein
MSNFDIFIKKYDNEIKKLNQKIKDLKDKFDIISYEHEGLLEDVRVLDIRVCELENKNGTNNIDNIPNNNNKEEGELSTYQICTRSKAKKMKNINEEIPVERQNSQDNKIFVALEPKIDNQEENKESKKKERKTKNSNNNKKKRQNKENSIFQNELNNNNINNINNDNNEVIDDNNINNISNGNNKLIDNNNINNINCNYDICSFGNNDFDNNSVLSTSDKVSVFSFKNQLINKNNNNIKSSNKPKIIDNYIPIELNKNKYINEQKDNYNNICNYNFKGKSLEDLINSSIIKSINELYLIVTSLTNYNKFDVDLPTFQGIFQSALDGDSAQKFHKFCDGEPNIIVVIETKSGCRFGGYTKIGFSSEGDSKSDDFAFLFSLDKMKIYKVRRKMKSIYCYAGCGPCFGEKDNKDFQISDNYLSQNSYVGRANGSFLNMSQDYELNQGNKEFQVDKLEIFKIIM